NNTEWDMEFMRLLEEDPEKLTEITIAEYAKRGGLEGAEVIMWLIMRGALTKKVKRIHQSYYLPSMTPIATLVFENEPEPDAKLDPAYLERVNRELSSEER